MWYWLYYLLAAFNVLTLALTLVLNHQTRDIFARSVDVNQAWSQRIDELGAIDLLAAGVEGAADDVFELPDLGSAGSRLRDSREAFDLRLAALRAELEDQVSPAEAAHLLSDLDLVGAGMADMTAEAELIFSDVAQGRSDEAVRRMPTLGHKDRVVRTYLTDLRWDVAAIQRENRVQQKSTAAGLARFEFLIAAGILLVIGATLVYGRKLAKRVEADARERERLYKALAKRERQLQELVGRLILAQEEERRRVAYELHDGLAQTAAGAHLHLRAFARRHQATMPAEKEELDRAVELAQRVVREARTVVAELRPTALDDLGLEAALEAEVEELQKEGWQVEFEAEIGPERLDPAIETVLFRVVQEALHNARKHAGADRARVAVRRTEQAVHLEVRDWGRGFDPAAVPAAGGGPGERVGLSGMRERVGLLGGRYDVQSQPGAGTRIAAEVPLKPPAESVGVARADSESAAPGSARAAVLPSRLAVTRSTPDATTRGASGD